MFCAINVKAVSDNARINFRDQIAPTTPGSRPTIGVIALNRWVANVIPDSKPWRASAYVALVWPIETTTPALRRRSMCSGSFAFQEPVLLSQQGHRSHKSAQSFPVIRFADGSTLWDAFFATFSMDLQGVGLKIYSGIDCGTPRAAVITARISSSDEVINVGKKLVQPDLRFALCMICGMVSAVISSLGITPPQPFSCRSMKPGLVACSV